MTELIFLSFTRFIDSTNTQYLRYFDLHSILLEVEKLKYLNRHQFLFHAKNHLHKLNQTDIAKILLI